MINGHNVVMVESNAVVKGTHIQVHGMLRSNLSAHAVTRTSYRNRAAVIFLVRK